MGLVLLVFFVVIHEVKRAIFIWKERATFCSLIVLGFLSMLAVFAEIAGLDFLGLLFDPILGLAILLTLSAFIVPMHVLFSKMQARSVIKALDKQQKRLFLIENLADLFEKNITFSRMMLPISDPIGWNKKAKIQLSILLDKTKDLVQSLNDNFSAYTTMAVAPIANEFTPKFQSDSIATTITTPVAQQYTAVLQPETPPQRSSALMQKILKK